MRLPALCLALLSAAAFAAEPFLKPNDVIALVGGEDMVVAGELGYLELLLTRALPEHRLKFRTLAWEGDTVFEQRRDLNFPPLEKQLDEIGATVVLCQFGQMESLMVVGRVGVPPAGVGVPPTRTSEAEPSAQSKDRSGKMPEPAGGTPTLPGLPEFIAAYEKLIDRMSGGGKRRFILVQPTGFYGSDKESSSRQDKIEEYAAAIQGLDDADPEKRRIVNYFPIGKQTDTDGVHLNDEGQDWAAYFIVQKLGLRPASRADDKKIFTPLLALITAKNRLWFDYWRVQNWAFLAGDRTSQPSSRDHLDKDKRWFPAERARFLPLIEAREKEIWAAAAKLAQP